MISSKEHSFGYLMAKEIDDDESIGCKTSFAQ